MRSVTALVAVTGAWALVHETRNTDQQDAIAERTIRSEAREECAIGELAREHRLTDAFERVERELAADKIGGSVESLRNNDAGRDRIERVLAERRCADHAGTRP